MIATRRASNLLRGAVVHQRTKTLASLFVPAIQLPAHISSSSRRGYHTTTTLGAPPPDPTTTTNTSTWNPSTRTRDFSHACNEYSASAYRSILSHRLGLPLLYALHGRDPSKLEYLSKEQQPVDKTQLEYLDGVFKKAVENWRKDSIEQEPKLTEILAEDIKKKLQKTYEEETFNALCGEISEGYEERERGGPTDIIISEAGSNEDENGPTPFAVIDLGLHSDDWWEPFHQGVTHLDLTLDKPLLLTVVTYNEDKNSSDACKFKMGVFLCCPRETTYSCRMSFLWYTKSNTLTDASEMFGRLLRVTADFQKWRDQSGEQQSDDGYQYFGSNFCKVGTGDNAVVLRSYDSRLRKTGRSSVVYQSEECKDIVGSVNTVVELKYGRLAAADKNCSENDECWSVSEDESLLIIAAPYRPGDHVAKTPKAFLPIIDQLVLLHSKGFVHGDIRGFNTVFGEKEEGGWLINFDSGGKAGSTYYPKGYNRRPDDGLRIGKEGALVEKCHDWYALGHLIFHVHRITPLDGADNDVKSMLFDKYELWTDSFTDRSPTSEEIKELKAFLSRDDLTVSPGRAFEL